MSTGFFCPGAGGSLAIADATAALASRFASSTDFVIIVIGLKAVGGIGASGLEGFKSAGATPLTGTGVFVLGLGRGTAGMIRPFLGPIGIDLAVAAASCAIFGAGGASAAATSGFDAVGGGGAFCGCVGGLGDVDELGNFTVAIGLGDRGFEAGLLPSTLAGSGGAVC